MSRLGNHSSCSSEASDSQSILESVSVSLHQAAQPLAVLHGMLEHALLEQRTAEEYREVLLKLTAEAHRLTTSFNQLREILCPAELTTKTADGRHLSSSLDSECAVSAGTERKHV
jgi:hypothetical protein